MGDFFFISYSSVDGASLAIRLADNLEAGPPVIGVWFDKRTLRPGEDWDEQVGEAIRTCKGLIFIMTADSVRPDSVCKNEWVRALKYKKAIIPLLADRSVDAPFRLSSREHIDFVGPFGSAIARLRNHIAWMDSPDGHLQALRHRMSDAQRELPRVEPDQQVRIRDDIAELERQISQQQKVISDPGAVQQRVQKSIDAGLEGERKPAQNISGISRSKFINPPPLIAPTWFQDRHFESQQIGEFLKDDSLRQLTIVGRGGVGKTAMVCRLLRAVENGQLPDEGGPLTVDGIVYLSAARSFHRPNVPDLFAGLTALLAEETSQQLDSIYTNPQSTTRATMEALVQAFPSGRTVVLLDNFEDMLAVDTGQIKDGELDGALRALLELPPHAIKVIITTRVAPAGLALVQPGLQRRLDLDSGLGHPFAENILRAMDADGRMGLQSAPDALLAAARERTRGYPRALEHLFGILSADRDTTLQDILNDTNEILPEQVLAVLVGEAFSRLDSTAQKVMQALAIYRYTVPPAAVDFLLQEYVPGIDSARVLSRLVNMQFARRDAGRYYIHQVDRDYALSRIVEGDSNDRYEEAPLLTRFALRHRAAEWFKLSRKPREAWKTLDDLAAQLSEFELRCEGQDYETAATVLLEFDFDYLLLWGHYRLLTELHERLRGRIEDYDLAFGSANNLGLAYYRMGQLEQASACHQEALELARKHENRSDEGTALGNLAMSVGDLGDSARAIGYNEEELTIERESGNRLGEAVALGNLAIFYGEIGQNQRALEYYLQALQIDVETQSRDHECEDRINIGSHLLDLGRPGEALPYLTRGITLAREIGYRLLEAAAHETLGDMHALEHNWASSQQELEQAIEIADEIGAMISDSARSRLALVCLYQNQLAKARQLIEAARAYDLPLENQRFWAMFGVICLRQGDLSAGKSAFTNAIDSADRLIAMTPTRYKAHDMKALSLCGIALCGEPSKIAGALVAFKTARAVSADRGIVESILLLFDALAHVDESGLLAGVRSVAEGASEQNSPSLT